MPKSSSHPNKVAYPDRATSSEKAQKKDDHPSGSRLILTAASGHQLFYCVNNCLECLGLVHSEVSHNLTVEGDTLCVNLTHEL